tara:strand:+ start:88 stop:2064 length:1977 start_codon:yes stop_codon:yes gene_type:complete
LSSGDCLKLQEIALMIARTHIDDLRSRPIEWRIAKYNELKRSESDYEEKCAPNLMFRERLSNLGYFKLAKLKVAGSIKLRQEDLLEDESIKYLTDEFIQEEYDALEKMDKFRRLDFLTKEEIAKGIFNKEGQIYTIVKEWYDEQMDEFGKLLAPESGVQGMNEYLATAFRIEYDERFQKIQAGIIDYLKMDSGAPRKLFSAYEEAIRKTNQVEEERKLVEDQLLTTFSDNYRLEFEKAFSDLSSDRDLIADKLKEIEVLALSGSANPELIEEYTNRISGLNSRSEELLGSLRDKFGKMDEWQEKIRNHEVELSSAIEEATKDTRATLTAELHKIRSTNDDLVNKIKLFDDVKLKIGVQNQGLDDRISNIRKSLEDGSDYRLVTVDEARIMEMNFIGKFGLKMTDSFPYTFQDPLHNGKIVVKKPSDYSLSFLDERHQLENIAGLSEDNIALIPHNKRSIYTISRKQFLKDNLKIKIEAAFLSRIETYARNFADTKPLSLSHFLRFIESILDSAQGGEYLHIVGIGSATGFDENLQSYVSSDEFHKNFVSKHLAICLIDLETGDITYNHLDNRISDYVHLFEQEFDNDKVEKVKQFVKAEKYLGDTITASKTSKETGLDMRIIKKTFYELEKKGEGEVITVKKKSEDGEKTESLVLKIR